ncbi:MAG: type II toxin-antitoxin system VapC family toxin [Gammaproteobacteria bacterium]|nr:type II toxin-antitoxin system VapC family toxin [Gammaproteobacteria bacterium]MYF49919.1 type II toxin-antitoxin system VapC family toxin [Gammaproteobacteria bacterium]
MNRSVYIESSVISYLAARPSRDLVIAGHQAVTAEWWKNHRSRYDVYVSPLVEEEISAGDASAAAERLAVIADIPSVSIAPEAGSLASAILSSKAVPTNSVRDALHIAIAATQGIDYLITWNFKHINNASTRNMIVSVVSDSGLICPVLCSPEELMGEDDAK